MIYKPMTIVATSAVVTIMRKLSQVLDRNETDGMFVSPLSATGNLPATHFVSSGQIPLSYAQAALSPLLIHTQAQAAFLKEGIPYPFTLAQVTAMLSGCSISDGIRTVIIDTVPTVVAETPFDFISRLGLKPIQ